MRFLTLIFFSALAAYGDVQLPAVLSSHMVIQRGIPVHIWGRATPGEPVSVTFREAHAGTTADAIGLWSVYLPSVEAGGPYEITVKGNNTIRLEDVLAGDVWVASGQSNMEFRVSLGLNADAEIAAANYPRIRLLYVQTSVADHPLDDIAVKHPWRACTPEAVADFSAIAYFFGRDLNQKLDVPIGLVDTSWGGTPAESWTSLRALSADASLMPVFAEWAKTTGELIPVRLRRAKQIADWEQAVERAKADGKPAPSRPWAANDAGEWSPASLYNAMIAPLTRFPIRGAIWYQGESNASTERAPLYARLFRTMIEDWRQAWAIGDFPFLFVQIANFKTGADAKWPELRDAQRQTLALVNTGMAVTIDIGNTTDIHPKNKQEVGKRLALAARAIAFGEKIEYSGPMFRQSVPEGGNLRAWFDHAGTGLTAKDGPLKGFEVAGADRAFVPAEARIEGNSVVVSAPSVPAPAYVRYAWKDDPECNLYNAEGLPASPFRSGSW